MQAMVREFKEETGLERLIIGWRHFCTEIEPFGSYVHFYVGTSRISGDLIRHENDVGEPLAWHHIHGVGRDLPTVGNLQWLLPLAMDKRLRKHVVVEAAGDIREEPTW
jgi:8-oxo-dGTP pyrophosphatase MutT (NUDIX family)